MNFTTFANSSECATYRIRRHSSQKGQGKEVACNLRKALCDASASGALRLVSAKAKKALPEFKGHYAPEHWEVIARFHSLADRIKGDKLAATFNLDKVEVVA